MWAVPGAQICVRYGAGTKFVPGKKRNETAVVPTETGCPSHKFRLRSRTSEPETPDTLRGERRRYCVHNSPTFQETKVVNVGAIMRGGGFRD
eukprot:1507143-Rhodomonas_salina.1